MEYLYGRNRAVAGSGEPAITAAGKHVVVIGGGDTGADCVASAHREGAASVTQIELLGEPPAHRLDELTPWPLWPMKMRPLVRDQGGRRADLRALDHRPLGRRARRADPLGAELGRAAVRAGARHRGGASGRPRAARDGVPRPGAAAPRRARRRARPARQRGDARLRDLRPRRLRRRRRAPRPVADRLGDRGGSPLRGRRRRAGSPTRIPPGSPAPARPAAPGSVRRLQRPAVAALGERLGRLEDVQRQLPARAVRAPRPQGGDELVAARSRASRAPPRDSRATTSDSRPRRTRRRPRTRSRPAGRASPRCRRPEPAQILVCGPRS